MAVSPFLREFLSCPMSWPAEVLAGNETGDRGEWGGSEEGCEKAFRPKSLVKPSDEDLRWVPPWFPHVKNRSRRWILLQPSEMTILIKASSGGLVIALSKPKVKAKINSKVLFNRSLDIEVLKVPSFPNNDRLASSRTVWLAADLFRKFFVYWLEALRMGVVGIVIYARLIWFNSPLGSRIYGLNLCNLGAPVLTEKARTGVGGEWVLSICYVTSSVEMDYEYGSMPSCVALICYLWCLVDGTINMSLFSGFVHTILYWVDICLFGVSLNTVHSWVQCVPVWWVWRHCSFLDWNCGSFTYYHTNCSLLVSVLFVNLLGPCSRKIVRNLLYRWILIEADLVTVWTTKASLDGLALCIGYHGLCYICGPPRSLVLWMLCLFKSYLLVLLKNLIWTVFLGSVTVCIRFLLVFLGNRRLILISKCL